MAKIQTEPKIVRHISLTHNEDEFIRQQAETAGMSITSYIRQQALTGSVNTYTKDIFAAHAEKISKIYEWVKLIRFESLSEDPMLREIELSIIDDDIEDLIKLEKQILEAIKVWL